MPDNSVYARLFNRLNELIPGFQTVNAGAVFSTTPHTTRKVTAFCHVAATEGPMLLIELVGEHSNKAADLPSTCLKLRVDTSNWLAEVLEMEDAFGYQIVYTGTQGVNARRSQINRLALEWLQKLVRFSLLSRPADELLAA